MPDPRFSDTKTKLWDLSGEGLASEVCGVVGVSREGSAPSAEVNGVRDPFQRLPFRRDGDDGVQFPVSLVVDPGSTVDAIGGFEQPSEQSGKSTMIVQADEPPGSRSATLSRADALAGGSGKRFPEHMGPVSHILRGTEGHGCLLLHDAREHSPDDAGALPGGGFLHVESRENGKIRTRMGDAFGPMRLGLSSGQPFTGTAGATIADVEAALAPPRTSTTPRNPDPAPEDVARWQSEAAALRGVQERTPDQQARLTQLESRITSASQAQFASRAGSGSAVQGGVPGLGFVGSRPPVQGAQLVVEGTNEQRVDAEEELARLDDLAATGRITADQNRRRSALRQALSGSYTIQAGLGAGADGTIHGAQVVEEATAEQVRAIQSRVWFLEAERRRRALTAGEQQELARLRQVMSGNISLTLGLPGGGDFSDARGRIVSVAPDGSESISVFGQSRKLTGAASVGIAPRNPQEFAVAVRHSQDRIRALRQDVQGLQQRLDAANAGQPAPAAQVVGGVASTNILATQAQQLAQAQGAPEDPWTLYQAIQASRAEIAYHIDYLGALGVTAVAGGQPPTTDAEQRLAAIATAAASGAGTGPWLNGVQTSTLFGTWEKAGWPIAFNAPAGEDAHDLQAHGPQWGLGYMLEWGGKWHPVCPMNGNIPPAPPVPTPEGPGGGTEPRLVDEHEAFEGGGFAGGIPSPIQEFQSFALRKGPDPSYQPPPTERVLSAAPSVNRPDRPLPVEAPGSPVAPSEAFRRSVEGGAFDASAYALPRGHMQGQTVIQPARPGSMADVSQRRGGGPFNPDAPLVVRQNGLLTLDRDDFNVGMDVWGALETLSNRLNQAISTINELRPHGDNALDTAGVHVPVQATTTPYTDAVDGTLAHATDTDGNAAPFVKDGGKWRRDSHDHQRERVLGEGVKGTSKAILTRYATGRRVKDTDLPALGFDRARGVLVARGAVLDAEHAIESPEIVVTKAGVKIVRGYTDASDQTRIDLTGTAQVRFRASTSADDDSNEKGSAVYHDGTDTRWKLVATSGTLSNGAVLRATGAWEASYLDASEEQNGEVQVRVDGIDSSVDIGAGTHGKVRWFNGANVLTATADAMISRLGAGKLQVENASAVRGIITTSVDREERSYLEEYGAVSALTGSTSETPKGTCTVPSEILTAGAVIAAFAFVSLSDTVGATTCALRVKVGGTTVATVTVNDGGYASIQVQVRVATAGSSGVVVSTAIHGQGTEGSVIEHAEAALDLSTDLTITATLQNSDNALSSTLQAFSVKAEQSST